MGRIVRDVAAELGRTPAQVAISWARRWPPGRGTMIPIIGARTEAQLRDALGVTEFALPQDAIERLDEANRLPAEFPGSFLASDHVHGLIFGDTYDLIDLADAG
jgi:aryl-alcohol dehydrogenase-like predicted oxidoreductase